MSKRLPIIHPNAYLRPDWGSREWGDVSPGDRVRATDKLSPYPVPEGTLGTVVIDERGNFAIEFDNHIGRSIETRRDQVTLCVDTGRGGGR